MPSTLSHPVEHSDRGLMALAGMWFALNFVVLILPDSLPPASRRKAFRPSYQVLRFYSEDESTRLPCDRLPFRLMRPVDESSPAPLLVYLHGSGQRGADNVQQLKGLPAQMASPWLRRKFPCLLLAPQCPPGSSWTREESRLATLIEDVRDSHSVDPQRIYLTGVSMGGFGTWQLASQQPGLFAAVAPICGGGDPKTASRLVNVPVWAVHGSDDAVVPVEKSRDMVHAIREFGGEPRYTELKGVGHACWPQAYGKTVGVIPWLFEQRRTRLEINQAVIASPPASGTSTSRRSHE